MSTATDSTSVDAAQGHAPHSRRRRRRIRQLAASSLTRPPGFGWHWFAAAGVAAVLVAAALFAKSQRGRASSEYTVVRRDLDITVTERGNLESQENVEIVCQVDDIHGDSIDGTPVLWIAPNGASVKKGDLLVELDSAAHQERLDRQILVTEQARAQQIQAQARYENQITLNQTSRADAELRVRLSDLELQMFTDEKSGTHTLEVEEINRGIDDVNNEILAAKATLELKKNEKLGIESLFEMGYAGKSELDRTRLDFLQAENRYATKLNRLRTQLASLDRKQTYEHQMRLLRLQGNLQSAHRNLEQVILNNKAQLAQAKAAIDVADRALKKHEERLARYRQQLAMCKIRAPRDGLVVYAQSAGRSGRVAIGDGAVLRERQHILSLPNLTKMQVRTTVSESVVEHMRVGSPATIQIDAFPERTYRGTVRSVATLAEPGQSKRYQAIVAINEQVSRLKPGMAAVVRIDVTRLRNVLSVPLSTVVQDDGANWCFVDTRATVQRRRVTLGPRTGNFVQVCCGLREGDNIVLNPSRKNKGTPRRDVSRCAGQPRTTNQLSTL